QLRDCGASLPSVFFSLNTSSACSRQPVMVTGVAITAFPDPFLAELDLPFIGETEVLVTGASSAGATTFDVIAGAATTSGPPAAATTPPARPHDQTQPPAAGALIPTLR